MNSKEIIDYLKSEASEKYKENVIKMGIAEKFCIGLSTSTLRKFAKKLDKSNELAFELWNTHYHEARLLAVLTSCSPRSLARARRNTFPTFKKAFLLPLGPLSLSPKMQPKSVVSSSASCRM